MNFRGNKLFSGLLMVALLTLASASSLFGAAATVAYVWPVAGVTAPTAAQSSQVSSVVTDVTWAAAADTAVAINHNLGLPNATGLLGRPKVSWFCTVMGAGTFVPVFTFTSANILTVDKNSTAANTTGTCRVTVERPHSIVR